MFWKSRCLGKQRDMKEIVPILNSTILRPWQLPTKVIWACQCLTAFCWRTFMKLTRIKSIHFRRWKVMNALNLKTILTWISSMKFFGICICDVLQIIRNCSKWGEKKKAKAVLAKVSYEKVKFHDSASCNFKYMFLSKEASATHFYVRGKKAVRD